jgi:hypothetical protein
MQNKLTDLNNHLFAQLERLSDEDITSDKLEMEIKRTKAIGLIAENIINNGDLVVKAIKAVDGSFNADRKLPKMLE